MVKLFRQPISLSSFWVTSHERLSDFSASSWQRGESAVPLLVLRLMLLAIALAILAWSVYEAPTLYWLLYLTNWGLVLITIMMLSGVIVSIMAIAKPAHDSTGLPWYISTYWFFYNVSITIAFVISLLFWVLLFNPDMIEEMGIRFFWLDVASHGFNSCVALVELLACRTPLYLAHIIQPLGIALWYTTFTAIYYVVGGTDAMGQPFIYDILDWRYSNRTMVIVSVSFAILIVIYIIVFGVTVCRDKISSATIRTTSVQLARVPPDLERYPDIQGFV